MIGREKDNKKKKVIHNRNDSKRRLPVKSKKKMETGTKDYGSR